MFNYERFTKYLSTSRLVQTIFYNHQRSWFAAIAICLAVITVTLMSAPLVFTGDEPRFTYAAVSFWERGDFSLSRDNWDVWLINEGIDIGYPADKGTHSLFHAVFLSVIAGPFGLEAARWAQLIPLFVGVFALLTVVQSGAKSYISFAYVALLCLAVPIIPYSHLLYGEIWLFAGVSIVIAAMSAPKLNYIRITLIILALSVLMFVHIRSAAIVFILGLALLFKLVFVQRISRFELLKISLPVIFITAIWVAYQFKMSGQLFTASAPYKPSFQLFFERLNVQLFGARHGLLLYAPAALIGVSGLVIGVVKRDLLASFSLVALCTYIVSIVWGTASESYSARFWVCAMPLIIYGGIYWFRHANTAAYVVALVPILWTLVSIGLYIDWSEAFLVNRIWSAPYARFYEFTSQGINLAQFGAIEPESFGLRKVDTLARPYEYQIYTAVIFSLLCIAPLADLKGRTTVVALSFIAATYLYQQASLSPIPNQAVVKTKNNQNQDTIFITLPGNEEIRGIQFGDKHQPVFWPFRPFPEYVNVAAMDSSGNILLSFRTNALPYVRLPYGFTARSIEITKTSDSTESVVNLPLPVAVN